MTRLQLARQKCVFRAVMVCSRTVPLDETDVLVFCKVYSTVQVPTVHYSTSLVVWHVLCVFVRSLFFCVLDCSVQSLHTLERYHCMCVCDNTSLFYELWAQLLLYGSFLHRRVMIFHHISLSTLSTHLVSSFLPTTL